MKLTAFIALFATGCFWVTTKSEGEGLRKDVNSLNDRISTKEKALDDQVKQLQTVIDEATKVLKRNNADIGADVDGLRSDIRTANGLVTSINQGINDLKTAFDRYKKDNDQRMDALEARVAQIESGKPSANSSPTDLWRLGSAAFDAGRFADSVEIFKRLVATYPTDGKADDAQYFKGQAYGKLSDWEHAIGAYQTLVEKYPDSDLADDGLYFAALAAQQMKSCTEARTYLGLVKSKYPKSNVLGSSNTLDATIKKDLKNKSKCTS
ncbi:MAG TPA: tetratricopeptide repeat protein [Kofleriaceae bacterium]